MASPPAPQPGAVAAGDRSVVAGRDIRDSVIVTGDNVRVKLGLGAPVGAILALLGFRRAPKKRARRTPLAPRLRPFANHVDREREAGAVLDGGAVANLYGPAGIGKTHVLAHALALDAAGSWPDGAVYLFGKGRSRGDLLQALFEEFYECKPPFKAGDEQIARDLAGKRALLVFDSTALERDDAQQLLGAAPESQAVIASRERVLFDGTAVRVDGLAPDDALVVVEQELGRPLTDDERPAAARVCAALDGHPLAIRQAVSSGLPLAQLADELEGGARLYELAVKPVSEAESRVVHALLPFADAPVGVEHVAALVEDADAATALEALERRSVVESHSPTYSLAANLADELRERILVPLALDRALEHFSAWAEDASYERQLEEAPALLQLLRSAAADGRHEGVIRLGKAIDAAFAWGRRFGAWGEVIDAVLEAAGHCSDLAAQAWALHQRGTRAVAQGAIADGIHDLRRAEEIRTELGDEAGARASRHNIELAPRAVPPPGGGGHAAGGGWSPLLMVAAVAAVALVTAAVAAAVGVWDPPFGGGGGGDGSRTATLTIAKEGRGTGTVTGDAGALDCGVTCSAELAEGTAVRLTASPGRGSRFAGWGGACAGTGACDVTVSGAVSVTARFVPEQPRTLRVDLTGRGSGTVTSSPEGIRCGDACTRAFARGTTVAVRAEADDGSRFVSWGGDCAGRDETCSVRLDDDARVTARFERTTRPDSLTVEPVGDGQGTITSEPERIACPETCVASFARGTRVTLTADPADGSTFAGWSDPACPGTGPCELTIVGATTLQARFDPESGTPTLTVKKPGSGSGTVTSEPPGIECGDACAAPFAGGTTVTLRAAADDGSIFAGWSEEACGTEPTCELTLSSDRTVEATFNPAPPPVRLAIGNRGGGTVTIQPAGITCSESCTRELPPGRVTLVAAPAEGSAFSGWSGICKGQGESCTFDLVESTSIAVSFTSNPR